MYYREIIIEKACAVAKQCVDINTYHKELDHMSKSVRGATAILNRYLSTGPYMGRFRTANGILARKFKITPGGSNTTGAAVRLLVPPTEGLCSKPWHQSKGHHVSLG